MRNFKNILLLILVGSVSLGLGACGAKDRGAAGGRSFSDRHNPGGQNSDRTNRDGKSQDEHSLPKGSGYMTVMNSTSLQDTRYERDIDNSKKQVTISCEKYYEDKTTKKPDLRIIVNAKSSQEKTHKFEFRTSSYDFSRGNTQLALNWSKEFSFDYFIGDFESPKFSLDYNVSEAGKSCSYSVDNASASFSGQLICYDVSSRGHSDHVDIAVKFNCTLENVTEM